MNTDKFSFVGKEESSAREKKAVMRATMKRRRAENENRDVKEALLTENFFRSGFAEKTRFLVYLSFSSEAPTDKLIEKLKALHKTVYCPRMEGKEMYAVPLGEDFTVSPYGIREPVGERYDGEIDVAVLPLLAVDERGCRLGYGGGYYDRFLKKHPETLPIAYCFDFQVVRKVPCEAFDVRAAFLVTDKRAMPAKK